MRMQRIARFLLWFGLSLFCLGLIGMWVSCASAVMDMEPKRNTGGAISTLLILVSLLVIAGGAFLKAITSYGSEWEEDANE